MKFIEIWEVTWFAHVLICYIQPGVWCILITSFYFRSHKWMFTCMILCLFIVVFIFLYCYNMVTVVNSKVNMFVQISLFDWLWFIIVWDIHVFKYAFCQASEQCLCAFIWDLTLELVAAVQLQTRFCFSLSSWLVYFRIDKFRESYEHFHLLPANIYDILNLEMQPQRTIRMVKWENGCNPSRMWK